MAVGSFNGVNLYHEILRSGMPLILVHGSWGDHHNWDSVAPALAQYFKVISYDRRGHSQSERPTGQGTVRDDADDLAALIDGLGIDSAHVAGNSFGASIALRLACQRPEVFRSLIVHEPPLLSFLADDPKTKPMLDVVKGRIGAVVARLEAGDLESGARQFVETIAFGPGAWENELTTELRQTFIFNAPTFLDEAHDPEQLTLDLAGLRTFPHPAFVSGGEISPPIFPPIVATVVGAIPGARYTRFAGAGHVPHLTHPAEYVRAVHAFIAETAGG